MLDVSGTGITQLRVEQEIITHNHDSTSRKVRGRYFVNNYFGHFMTLHIEWEWEIQS